MTDGLLLSHYTPLHRKLWRRFSSPIYFSSNIFRYCSFIKTSYTNPTTTANTSHRYRLFMPSFTIVIDRSITPLLHYNNIINYTSSLYSILDRCVNQQLITCYDLTEYGVHLYFVKYSMIPMTVVKSIHFMGGLSDFTGNKS